MDKKKIVAGCMAAALAGEIVAEHKTDLFFPQEDHVPESPYVMPGYSLNPITVAASTAMSWNLDWIKK